MSIQFQTEEMPEYLAVRFTGAIDKAWPYFELIAELCNCANKNKLLLDFTQTHGGVLLSHRYYLGDKAVTFMLHKLVKVAVVSSPEQLDYNKFGETVARNRWVNLRVFTSDEDAEAWLLLGAPKASAAGSH